MKRGFSFCVALAFFSPLLAQENQAPKPQQPALETQKDQPPPFKRIEWERTIDAYYSSIDMIINLSKDPIQNVGEKSEFDVYKDLLADSYRPRMLLFEASVNPLPIMGVLVRENAPDFYQKAVVGGEEFNLIRAVTSGFQEPYAISMFLGNVVRYQPVYHSEEEREKNQQDGYQSSMGYTGFLVSGGTHHIYDDMMFRDNWLEFEWKIKGDQMFTLQKMQWSYRIGTKIHDNIYISDVAYFGIRRNRLDFTASAWSFIANSGFDFQLDFKLSTMRPIRQYFELNKKWPFRESLAFTLAVGFTWESKDIYSGPLDISNGNDNFQVLLRPNVEF